MTCMKGTQLDFSLAQNILSAQKVGASYRELKGLAEKAITFSIEESIGASRLQYPYPGQPCFLKEGQNHENA